MVRQDHSNDLRLIEAGFPCHQVGAETQRERDTGKAPPTHRMHVWWARRPLTPSRAAILGSLLPAGTDNEWFLRELGIEKVVALVNGTEWILTGTILNRIECDELGNKVLKVDSAVLRAIGREQIDRENQRTIIDKIIRHNQSLQSDPAIQKWRKLCVPIPNPLPNIGEDLMILQKTADPSWFRRLMEIVKGVGVRIPNLYGYPRAYGHHPQLQYDDIVVLDPTAGGGSIPFEALRLGYKVIANDLNPIATTILKSTLNYPAEFGTELLEPLSKWGQELAKSLDNRLGCVFPSIFGLPNDEKRLLVSHLSKYPDLIDEYDYENTTTYLFARQVTCPHCGGEAPLLNSTWLSKTGEKWGVSIITDGRTRKGKVQFKIYRVKGNRGSNGEDPNFATVNNGVGKCIHCHQAISSDEIKSQARGESPHGKWEDRLYAIAAVRLQPKLDKYGEPQQYKTGKRAGEIKTEKVRFFRVPNQEDLNALKKAEELLQGQWTKWEKQGIIPTERIPEGNDMRPIIYGMNRWCDMFTPRQLLGHLTLIEELNSIKPEILKRLGEERGRAVITYLQFMIDKGIDYNSKQTRWHYSRGVLINTFGRHDFSLKWTFGEMIFSGPHSGFLWGLSQVLDAYKGIAELMEPLRKRLEDKKPPVTILNGTAAHLNIPDLSVDLVCIDPPYYNNVQYAELSDYFYVWQRRTLGDLYPEIFQRRLTNKIDEAVANPVRDGSSRNATEEYEKLMSEIFLECSRVLKDGGVMTIMFTHKTQEAWEALTRSLIENGWIITSSMPVESEAASSIHQKGMAAAASSIFLTCRKRLGGDGSPAVWSGFGGEGVAKKVREAVHQALLEFASLELNSVDEMVASYGRALKVLSEHWPVLDGNQHVSPIRAMNEASTVVAQYQMIRLTRGRLQVNDLISEAAMALTLYGIFGLAGFPYDEALNLSRSLNIRLEGRTGGYNVSDHMIGMNDEHNGIKSSRRSDEYFGYHAPLLRRGSKLRLALPEERDHRRLENPQTEWDVLQGLILAYREGDIPVARAYLNQRGEGREGIIKDMLSVWATQMVYEDIRREGEAILFGLK